MRQATGTPWNGFAFFGLGGNTVEAYRWLTLIPLFCMPVWRRFVDTLILQGKIPQKALDDPKVAVHAVQWTAPKFESVDPVKDAAAELKMIRTGTLDLFEAISRNGYDPEERLQKIARINRILDKLEIILDCDPRNVTDRGQEQPAASDERIPSSKPTVAGSKVPPSRMPTPKRSRSCSRARLLRAPGIRLRGFIARRKRFT